MLIKKILVPVDLSDLSFAALDMAVPLADATGAFIELLTVEPLVVGDPYAPPVRHDPGAAVRDMRALFSNWAARHPGVRADGAQVKFIARQGLVVEEILDVAKSHACDLIVMASHCRKGLAHMLIGSVTEAVVRRAECPVMAVPPQVLQAGGIVTGAGRG